MSPGEVGKWLFALSVAGLGVLSLVSGDFASAWQPVPAWVPFRAPLAYASGAILLLAGLGVLSRRTVVASAVILTIDFAIWLVLLRLAAMTSLMDAGQWLGAGETAVLVCGGGALLAMSVSGGSRLARAAASPLSRRFIQLLLAVALPLIGQSHFVYLKAALTFVPPYLPAPAAWAYFTGACHIAAGLALLFSVVPRLAVTMEGIMMALFGVLVWVPRVVATPDNRVVWTAMLVSFAYGASCLIVAQMFRPQEEVGDARLLSPLPLRERAQNLALSRTRAPAKPQ